MADFKIKYPLSGSALNTITLALDGGGSGLASSSTLLAGRASTAVVNTSNIDLDHLVSGKIRVGSSGVAAGQIEIWAYAQIGGDDSTPVYPDGISGTDGTDSLTSRNVIFAGLRLLDVIEAVAATAGNDITYYFGPISIADAFGKLPRRWGLFVVHNTSAALSGTAANHEFVYERIQAQSV